MLRSLGEGAAVGSVPLAWEAVRPMGPASPESTRTGPSGSQGGEEGFGSVGS